jgi:hypothetical protein
MKKHFFILVAFIVIAITSNAQITLQSFQIGSNYVQNNALRVPKSDEATPFKFLVVLSRGITSTGGYVSGNCKILLVYTESVNASDGAIKSDPSTITLYTKNVTSSDYNQNQAVLADLDATLPANKVNGRILIINEYLDNQNVSRINYSSTRYNIYVVPPVVIPPSPWITKLDNSMRYNGSDWSCNIEWDVSKDNTPTVTFEVYQNGVFKGIFASSTANDGAERMDWTNYADITGHTYSNIQLKIISDANPSHSYMTPKFDMQVD